MDWHASARHIRRTCRPGGGVPEIVIETDDAVHFGVGDIERVGDQRDGGLIDVSELFLQCMQNRQQRAGQVLQFPNP